MTPRQTNAAPTPTVRSSIDVPPDLIMGLLGSADENLRALERTLSAELHARGNTVTLSGSPADVALAERVVTELIALVAGGQVLTPDVVRRSIAMLTGDASESPAEVLSLDVLSRRGKTIRPKTLNQKRYVDAIDSNTVVFGIGPAGTGKTYLAMAKAVTRRDEPGDNRGGLGCGIPGHIVAQHPGDAGKSAAAVRKRLVGAEVTAAIAKAATTTPKNRKTSSLETS